MNRFFCNFSENIGTRNRWFHFGGDPDQHLCPEFFFFFLGGGEIGVLTNCLSEFSECYSSLNLYFTFDSPFRYPNSFR